MKNGKTITVQIGFIIIFIFAIILISCGSTKESLSISNDEKVAFEQVEGDTVTISSDKTEYEIIIIEPGFYTWLNSIAKPEGYYSQSFLENRNYLMVLEWNRRVLQPMRYNPNLYELQIDYAQNIDYGYEVNYKLYNYFIYFQRKYNQRLGPFIPRI
jgi:signal peptidase I